MRHKANKAPFHKVYIVIGNVQPFGNFGYFFKDRRKEFFGKKLGVLRIDLSIDLLAGFVRLINQYIGAVFSVLQLVHKAVFFKDRYFVLNEYGVDAKLLGNFVDSPRLMIRSISDVLRNDLCKKI